jgi:outer membrane protein OmpA-like peptidoglycan-associated protein
MTEQRTKSCTLCMLIPLILGALGLTALYWYTKDSKAEQIENDLSLKSNQLLSDSQVGGAVVNMEGRDATITGTVVSESRSKEIGHIIAGMPGIHVVDNRLEIAKPEPIIEAPKAEMAPEPITKPEPEIALAPEMEPEPEPEPELQAEAVEKLLQALDLSGITFLFGSDVIATEGKLILDDVANILAEHPEFDASIEGHTDSVGNDELNFELSQQRAQSVLNYLANKGIQTERLNATGFGESLPIATNDSTEGRAFNRRIEFVVTRNN